MMTRPAAPSARHANVAIFVPHAGCPHQCSFCDQRAISGTRCQPSPDDVRTACETALATLPAGSCAEIAFFGGSFTAIDRKLMVSLLQAAAPYVHGRGGNGAFRGIRVSTRPDAVDDEVLDLLKSYGVVAVELGAQSMDDAVLTANHRGHTADDVRRAAALIHEAGLELGLQMMTGLYGSIDDTDHATARQLVALRPATMRIYPTVVMAHTELAERYRRGTYTPPSLEQAVSLCADLLRYVERECGIPVIRLGLHAGSELQQQRLAGPWHPAFRELCDSRLYLTDALARLRQQFPQGGKVILRVSPRAVSRMVGQGRCNISILAGEGYAVTVRGDAALSLWDIRVEPAEMFAGLGL